jgi:hypothetical protein
VQYDDVGKGKDQDGRNQARERSSQALC